MRRNVITLCVLGSIVLYAEPSVYGNSSNFTSPNKIIENNKKSIVQLRRKIANQSEQIAGLKSIVEGLSATIHELKQSMQSSTSSTMDENRFLQDLGMKIDEISANYVRKDELQKFTGREKSTLAEVAKETTTQAESTTQTKPTTQSVEAASPQKAYSEGVRLFVKHRYDEARKRFVLTDKKGYKAASSNYYLGEMAYYSKAYEDAIFYYKKSAGLNDKASYIDTLLLHTAIALEKRGENAQAKVFYENIIANYEGKKTAKIAQERLGKLQ